jgi:hypothetical protein
MTVQAGTELDLDLAAMVGEMEAPPCEHSQHEARIGKSHNDEPATHYARGHCECFGTTEIYAICPGFAAWIPSGVPIRCAKCKTHTYSDLMYEIVAPINSTIR